MQNILSGFFFLSWASFLDMENLPQCVIGFELNQDVVFLKICTFLRSSFYSGAIRLRPIFWRANKLGFCSLLPSPLFKFGWEAKLLWSNFPKPSCLLLSPGVGRNLLSFLGNLKENAHCLQVWVQLVVASYWLDFFVRSKSRPKLTEWTNLIINDTVLTLPTI